MYDRELAANILQQISKARKTILSRFEPITQASDFTNNPQGMEKLDASVCY